MISFLIEASINKENQGAINEPVEDAVGDIEVEDEDEYA